MMKKPYELSPLLSTGEVDGGLKTDMLLPGLSELWRLLTTCFGDRGPQHWTGALVKRQSKTCTEISPCRSIANGCVLRSGHSLG
jgi:hypothetical protein